MNKGKNNASYFTLLIYKLVMYNFIYLASNELCSAGLVKRVVLKQICQVSSPNIFKASTSFLKAHVFVLKVIEL